MTEDSEKFTCEKCGKDFDSEKGLHIHQGEVHSSSQVEKQENNNSEDESKIALSINTVIMGVFVLGLAIGFAGGQYVSQGELIGAQNNPTPAKDSGDNTQPSNNDDNQQETDKISMDQIEMEGEPVLGDEDAPVTMVMYEDFECPFCKRFEDNAFQDIKKNYIDTGKVKAVWKDRPLARLHPWANPAAAAMECVYREGGNDAFWSVKAKIFENQNSLSTSNVESKIKSWAANQGVSESAVQSCIDNDNPMEEVNADSREGSQVGADGTPTMIINGEKIVGAQPFRNFKQVIESQLS